MSLAGFETAILHTVMRLLRRFVGGDFGLDLPICSRAFSAFSAAFDPFWTCRISPLRGGGPCPSFAVWVFEYTIAADNVDYENSTIWRDLYKQGECLEVRSEATAFRDNEGGLLSPNT